MRTLKLLALVAVLALASIASAQTLTRSLVLKPAGAVGTLTLTTGAVTALQTYQITLPTNGASLQGPIVKTSTATGDKTWTFGQIDLTSNAATTGDITGTLGVPNGGTGLSSITAGAILVGDGTNPVSVLAPGANTTVLTMSGGSPTWSDIDNLNTTAGAAPVTNINGTDNNAGSGTESVTNIGYNVPVLDADDNASTTNINGNTTIGSLTGADGLPTSLTINSNTVFNGSVQLPLTTDNIWVGVGNVATPYAPGTAGQVLTVVGTTPTWSSTLGNAANPFTINASNLTLNDNDGDVNIGAGTSNNTINLGNNTGPTTTVIEGNLNLTGATVSLTLPTNNVWTGVANVATPLAPTASAIFVTAGAGNVVPQWSTTLPSGLTIPGATITTPTITGGTINSTSIGATTPSTGAFTTLSSTGNSTIGTGAATTNSFGTGAGATNTIGDATGVGLTTIAGDVTFSAPAGDVTFTNMPNLPLPLNNIYVGNVSNYAQAFPTTASSVMTSTAGGAPQWTAVLPIANGGTNSSTIGAAGTVSYSTGTAYASTVAGTSGQILQSNGAGAPTWTNVGNLLASASAAYTVTAGDETAGFAVITPAGSLGYDLSSRVIITLETVSGPSQAATISDRLAGSFRVYTGAMTAGDIINYIVIDTTP